MTVSTGDAQTIIYYIPSVSGPDAVTTVPPPPDTGAETIQHTLFDKPLDLYTPVEGLLLCIVVIMTALAVNKFLGGFKWMR